MEKMSPTEGARKNSEIHDALVYMESRAHFKQGSDWKCGHQKSPLYYWNGIKMDSRTKILT